jgi:predicted RecA/RadA family phage recombinase
MATNFVQPGSVLTLTAPSGGVTAGNLYIIGAMAVVAMDSALEGATFAGAIDGVWDLPKAPSQAWTEGAAINWDNSSNKRCSTAATAGFFPLGLAVTAVGSGAGELVGRVRLNAAATAAIAGT